MDYYTRKERAITYIDKLLKIKEPVSIPAIKLLIIQKYALSPKFVDDYLELKEELSQVTILNKEVCLK